MRQKNLIALIALLLTVALAVGAVVALAGLAPADDTYQIAPGADMDPDGAPRIAAGMSMDPDGVLAPARLLVS